MMPLTQTQWAVRAPAGQTPPKQAASAGLAQASAAPCWEAALLQDSSPMAILPNNPELFAGLIEGMRDSLESAYARSTNRSDTYHLTAWAKVCEELDTPMWRTDVAANSGIDPVGHRRELVLNALAFLRMYGRMQPRSKSSPAADPRSCMAKLTPWRASTRSAATRWRPSPS